MSDDKKECEKHMKDLSDDDLEEINMCLSDCRDKIDHARKCCQDVSTGLTFKQFLFGTLPGNIILVLIAYTLLQMVLNIEIGV